MWMFEMLLMGRRCCRRSFKPVGKGSGIQRHAERVRSAAITDVEAKWDGVGMTSKDKGM